VRSTSNRAERASSHFVPAAFSACLNNTIRHTRQPPDQTTAVNERDQAYQADQDAMNAATSNSKLEDAHNGATSDAEASLTSQARSGSDVSGHKKQRISSSLKRVIDETQLPPEEAEKLESRRAYNRECATRARKRTKSLVVQLSDQVRILQADKDDLRRENAVIRAQLQSLERQNQTLVFKHGLVERSHHANMPMSPLMLSPMGGFQQPCMNLDTALTGLLSAQQAAARNQLLRPMNP
jgi:hypothetical protein